MTDQYKFIAFGDWMPDNPEFGEVALKTEKNGLPLFGAYRPLRKKSILCAVADGPVTGGLAHYYQQTISAQFARPESDDSAGLWVRPGHNFIPFSGAMELYQAIDEAAPSDNDRIYSPGLPVLSNRAVVILQDLTSPGSTAGHVFRWRYDIENSTGAWEVRAELIEGTTTIASDIVTGTGNLPWTQRQRAVTALEAATIVSYAALSVRFSAAVAGAANQKARPDGDVSGATWGNEFGDLVNLYQSIDETSASDSDYVQNQPLSPGQTTTYTTTLSDLIDPYVASNLLSATYRMRAINAGINVTVELLQDAVLIATGTATNVSTSFANTTLTPTGDESVTDYTKLRLRWTVAYPAAVASTQYQFARPVADLDLGAWLTAPLWSKVDETTSDPADLISSPGDDPGGTYACTLQLGPLVNPKDTSAHVLSFTAVRTGPVDMNFRAELYCSSTFVTVLQVTLTGTSQLFAYTLLPGEAATITDYTDLRLKLVRLTHGAADNEAVVYWAEFKCPQPRALRVSWAEVTAPSAARAGISWFELEVPSASSTFLSDKVVLYAGSETKLYEVTAAAFTNVSKAGNYASGTVHPLGWEGATWGEDVIFTNKVDPVQIRTAGASLFADMITSPSPAPKAQFVGVVRDQVWLANINLAGHFSDEGWWSAVDDAANFTKSPTTLSDWQRFRQTPGQITGFVGGETATIFKRNSIIRGTFVGAPQVYAFSVLSSGTGTPYSKSIIVDGDTIYFRAADNFYRLAPGEQPVAIGDKVLCKFLKDAKFSLDAMALTTVTDPRHEEQVIIGGKCGFSRLLYWTYQGKDDPLYKHSRAVVYDTAADRWGFVQDSGLNTALVVSKPNVTVSDDFMLKGIVGFDWSGSSTAWFQHSGETTYSMTLVSKIQTVVDGKNVKVNGIRPIFSTDIISSGLWPEIAITTECSNDPKMQYGVSTQTKTTTQATKDGWVGWHDSGEFWRFTILIPELTLAMIKEFIGVGINYVVENR